MFAVQLSNFQLNNDMSIASSAMVGNMEIGVFATAIYNNTLGTTDAQYSFSESISIVNTNTLTTSTTSTHARTESMTTTMGFTGGSLNVWSVNVSRHLMWSKYVAILSCNTTIIGRIGHVYANYGMHTY